MASNVYIQDLCNQIHRLDISERSNTLIDDIEHLIHKKCLIPHSDQRLWQNGKLLRNADTLHINPNEFMLINVSLSLNGGKGGFGSMLRAAGKLNKTTNKSAMRDLSGRRQRFVEQEKELREWIKNQKNSKPMSQKEIQNDFRHIKKYGTLPEKRLCHKGAYCRHRNQCPYVHPDNDNDDIRKNKKRKNNFEKFVFEQQTDEEMQNALFMGQINAKKMNEKYEKKMLTEKKMISLFGQSDDEQNVSQSSDVSESDFESEYTEIEHISHCHKLRLIQRKDCDFIICDVCSKEYEGPSFHCLNGCDFDLCADCVLNEDLIQIPKDEHLAAYDLESSEWKKIEQKDLGKYKSFSRNVDKKRRKKEKKLGLLGLENIDLRKKENKVTNGMNVNEKKESKKRKLSELDDKNGEVSIDLNKIENVNELKKYGMDLLKRELSGYGLKCGGTLEQRAKRLFLLKEHKLNDLPKHCFPVRKKKKRHKKQKIVSS